MSLIFPSFLVEGYEVHGIILYSSIDYRERIVHLERNQQTTGNVLIEVSPDYYLRIDVVNLWGDLAKRRARLGWNPSKTSFEELVKIMVNHDMAKVAAVRHPNRCSV